MKKAFYFLFGLLALSNSVWSQSPSSTNGDVFTPKGHLHALVIFVGFDHTTSADNVSGWDHDDIPDAAKGADNDLFNSAVGSSKDFIKQ